ncbi:TIGR02206 family membrane protein [Clostridium aestuarii]|uniref:TIGR02206 family membrane protein n=1 Tax=Clostridium aestuarii TaxID=338193 RepID=A0ABT4D1W7_9CLOT|nr:TIGR02206 family membrane protein [Clostridium aestuarii]MCY6485097.1 TIGR02206 family membrane protein [Clostridium aestuarii]
MKFDISMFWKSTTNNSQFESFSNGHVLSLTIIISIILLIYFNKEKLKNKHSRKIIGSSLAVILLLQQILLYLWYIDSGNFTLKESLPLYTCRICEILCIFMVIKGNRKLFDIVYFWGVSGASIALLTPDTSGFKFPHIMYVQFFIGHGCILISIAFMFFVYNYIPTINSLKRTFKWSFIYIFIVGGFNYLVNGNYSYLRQKPLTSSPLDYLPPYPYYIPIFVGFIFTLFIILYLPFHFHSIKSSLPKQQEVT